jgi:hypothetical protein
MAQDYAEQTRCKSASANADAANVHVKSPPSFPKALIGRTQENTASSTGYADFVYFNETGDTSDFDTYGPRQTGTETRIFLENRLTCCDMGRKCIDGGRSLGVTLVLHQAKGERC